jgi:hypothetical protein
MTSNPRFPHTIKVTRVTPPPDEFTPSSETVTIYEGEGRCSRNTKSYMNAGVIKSDFIVAIPITSEVFAIDDDIEATTPSNRDVIRGKISTRPIVHNFGTDLYFNNSGL